MKIFGFTIGREPQQTNSAVVPRNDMDGALEYTSSMSAFYAGVLQQDVQASNEIDLVNKYRTLSLQPEVAKAVDDIVNEVFTYSDDESPISITLDNIPKNLAKESTKKIILEEFDYILNLMNFKRDCYEIFRRWYVDGRIYYEKVIDKDNITDGLKELRYIDPRTIKRVRELQKGKTLGFGYTKPSYVNYYVYNPLGLSSANQGIRISEDSISYAHSGLMNEASTMVFSYLQQSLKPFNQYRMMKDSMVVYYHTRAPERRVFNIEVGTMTTVKADQYIQETIKKFKRKATYDPTTGDVKDDKRFMTMNEDLWFAKRDGKGTDVSLMGGGANLAEIQQVVQMYKNELMESLNIPASRYLQDVTNFTLGRTSEISRDEVKFGKFITRLRNRFSMLIDDLLGTQLILKNIFTPEEWDEIRQYISYDYLEDTIFSEMKNAEMWNNRISNFANIEIYIGRYFSETWAVKNILNMNEEQWKMMQDEIEEENKKKQTVMSQFDQYSNSTQQLQHQDDVNQEMINKTNN